MTKLFQPFRSLGLITNGLPVDIQARGQKYFLTTVINSTFQIYDGEKLGLLFVGEEALGQIFSLCSYKDNTFVCTDTELLVYKRQKVQKRIKVQFQCDRLLVVGNILTLVGQKSIQLLGIDGLVGEKSIKDLELEAQVSNLCFNDDITALIHPSTYLNKILVAIGNSIELWNIDLYKKVHSFPEFPSMITTLVQSPALDTIAIGLLDGTVILYNLKIETQILKFQQQGPATCISFRTDGEHIMATSNNTGDVYLWDLGSKKLVYTMTSCHKGAINTCFFYHGMPLLLTSGGDNSIKQWLFDGQDKSPRLLKQRSGHESSPTKIQFMSPTTLLTSGLDSTVRFTSVVRDAQNTELSQGSLEHKSKKYGVEIEDLRLPNITQFAYSNHINR